MQLGMGACTLAGSGTRYLTGLGIGTRIRAFDAAELGGASGAEYLTGLGIGPSGGVCAATKCAGKRFDSGGGISDVVGRGYAGFEERTAMSEHSESRIGKIGLQLAALPWLGWAICLLPFG